MYVLCICVNEICKLWQYIECLPTRESQRGMKVKHKGWVSGIFYCICSAMPGTQSVVLGKTLAIIIRKSLSDQIFWFHPFSLSQLLFVIVCAFAWLVTYAYWMHRQSEALLQYEAVFIVPMHQVMWITFSTIGGGLYFQEFENATAFQWLSLFCGLFLNYFGLFQLMADSRKATSSVDVIQHNMDLPLTKHKFKSKSNLNPNPNSNRNQHQQ
ncbi:hypothetical protein RFI_12320 [Reticulomyxa filosa]|uniref:Magnesium transporter n=1 Tax=Reticulomyxa filosa TaxID=46433 RepID=X6NG08_RETFI|nr:hypothetical protein RFI_12320 [Reticulomyxa filosa]|eukprot:ETO24833.1 hypothetical protein RFI_12320 [Reticulomyxa filosa]